MRVVLHLSAGPKLTCARNLKRQMSPTQCLAKSVNQSPSYTQAGQSSNWDPTIGAYDLYNSSVVCARFEVDQTETTTATWLRAHRSWLVCPHFEGTAIRNGHIKLDLWRQRSWKVSPRQWARQTETSTANLTYGAHLLERSVLTRGHVFRKTHVKLTLVSNSHTLGSGAYAITNSSVVWAHLDFWRHHKVRVKTRIFFFFFFNNTVNNRLAN